MLTDAIIEEIVGYALREDHASEDVTTDALIPAGQQGIASLIAESSGILAGIDVAYKVFHMLNPAIKIDSRIEDGSKMQAGDVIAVIEG